MNLLRIQPAAAFSVNWTAYVMFIVVIGGFGTIEGPIIGAVIYFALLQSLSQYGTLYMLLLGVVAVIMVTLAPKGIWGYVVKRWNLHLFPVRRPARDGGAAAGRRPEAGREAGRRRGGVRLRPTDVAGRAGGPAEGPRRVTRMTGRRASGESRCGPPDRLVQLLVVAPGPGLGAVRMEGRDRHRSRRGEGTAQRRPGAGAGRHDPAAAGGRLLRRTHLQRAGRPLGPAADHGAPHPRRPRARGLHLHRRRHRAPAPRPRHHASGHVQAGPARPW